MNSEKITYRVYFIDNSPGDWVEYVEAESPEHAFAQVENNPNDWAYLVAEPLPAEMESECVCSETPILFKLVGPTEGKKYWWQCPNCQCLFDRPPNEINWEDERMDDDDTFWGPDGHLYQRYYDDDFEDPCGAPYYEEDGYYKMED